MTRRWAALVLVALVGASAAACSDDGPGEGEARLEVDGKATVERAGGGSETIDDGTDLSAGDRVTVTEGVAVMRLAGGTTFELRRGLDGAAGTSVVMDKVPVLEAGDLLVSAPDAAELEADGTQIVVREGSARVTRAFGMSASAYDADLALDSAGVEREVPALRQVAVPDLGRPRPPRPVDFEASDPWDRRYLGAAMEFGEELQVIADQLTNELPRNEGRTPGFFKLLLPGLEDESDLTQDLLEAVQADGARDQGETLVGAAISDLGKRGSFVDRWGEVFGFRDEGAAWGIVALDQEVQSDPLIGSVEEAFNASVEEIAQAPTDSQPPASVEPSGTDSGSEESNGGTDGGADGGGSTDGGTDGEAIEPTPPTLPPPVPPPSTPEPPAELEPIADPLEDLVEDLLGGLLG